MPQPHQVLGGRPDLMIPSVFRPHEGPPTVRVISALQANFIAVEEAGRTWEAEEEGQGESKAGDIAPGAGQKSGRIVAVQRIQLNPRNAVRISSEDPVNPIGETACIGRIYLFPKSTHAVDDLDVQFW